VLGILSRLEKERKKVPPLGLYVDLHLLLPYHVFWYYCRKSHWETLLGRVWGDDDLSPWMFWALPEGLEEL